MLLFLALPNLFVFVLTFLVALVGLRRWNENKNCRRRRYPPSLPSLPLVGSLPFLTGIAYLPELFMKKSLELGPMFTFKVGSTLALVLNTRQVIDETLSKQSLSFAGRESFYTDTQVLNRNLKGIISRQFNVEYRKYHYIIMTILKKFGFGSHSLTETGIVIELEAMTHELKMKNGVAFDPRALTLSVVSNVICSIIFGRRQDLAKGLIDVARLAEEFGDHIDAGLDAAPILRFIPKRWRNLQRLKNIHEQYIGLLRQEVNKCMADGANDSFVKSFVEIRGPECDGENLLYILRDLHAAASDPLLATLLWSFVFLANHPAVQDRMRKEIDEAVPRDQFPSYEDRNKLPYVNATILEIMRIRTVAPLSVPRLTLRDTEVGGLFVPAGAVVFPNLHAVHMDPNVFVEPDKFRPERLLDEENNVAKDLVIPFSIGRRSCLGESLARQELFLTLSCLVQRFTIRPPDGVQLNAEVDYCSDSIVRKPRPFEVRMIPREE